MMPSNRLSFIPAIAICILCSYCMAQDTNMVLRAYPVERNIFDEIFERDTGASPGEFVEMDGLGIATVDVQDFFEKAGVPFPDGSSMQYVREMSQLVVRNTVENQRIICRLLSFPRPMQVQIDVTLVRTCNTLPSIQNGVILTSLDLASTSSNDVDIIDSSSVTTRSGVNAISQRQGYASSNTNQMLESTLNVTPTVGPDGKSVDVTLVWTSTRASDSRTLVTEDNITTSVVVSDGVPLVLVARRGGEDDCLEFAVLTATVVNEVGEKIQYTPEGYRTN